MGRTKVAWRPTWTLGYVKKFQNITILANKIKSKGKIRQSKVRKWKIHVI